jgi:hypothetical protein
MNSFDRSIGRPDSQPPFRPAELPSQEDFGSPGVEFARMGNQVDDPRGENELSPTVYFPRLSETDQPPVSRQEYGVSPGAAPHYSSPERLGRVAIPTGPDTTPEKEVGSSAELQQELTPEDIAEAQYLLGYPIAPTPGLRPEEYDERRTIAMAALRAKDALRDDMKRAAAAAGITFSEDELASWEPNDTELAAIKHRLTVQRIRGRMLDGFAAFIADKRDTTNAFGTPLHKEQQTMVKGCGHFMLCAPPTTPQGGKGGHVEGPPGIGKTGAINVVTAAVKYNEAKEEPVKIVVIENTIDSLHQTHGSDGERGYGRFAPHMNVALHYTYKKETGNTMIMPAASFNYLMETGEMPDAHVVIADEGDVYANDNLREYAANKILIGFSATVDDAMRDIMPHEIYKLGVPAAIQRRRLAPMTAEVLHLDVPIDAADLPSDPKERRAKIEAIKLRARIEDIKPRIKADVEAGRGVFVRCPAGNDIDVAKILARELRDEVDVVVPNDGSWSPQFKTIPRRVRALEIGGSEHATAPGKRFQRAAFKSFAKGEADVFTFVSAIGRGHDNPRAKVIYDLDTRGGWRTKKQAYGRVGRLLYDENGEPLEARICNYFDPDRPDQYTGVQMLGGEPGQDKVRLRHSPLSNPTSTESEERALLVDAGILSPVTPATTIERLHVAHGPEPVVTPDPPESIRPPEVAEARKPVQALTFSQAVDRLGVTSVFLRNLYETHGFKQADTITTEDLGAMLELSYPHTQVEPQPLPPAGYVSDEEIIRQAGFEHLNPVRLRLMAQYRGYTLHKFSDRGKAGYYYPQERLPELIEALNTPLSPSS